MTWPRPVPLIGDTTAASHRIADPGGWAFDPDARAALHAVIAGRRDIRRYRPDAVPPDLLSAVLAAGHAAPSVGHSQPWRFIVVTEAGTRDKAAAMADRERLRQAQQLTPDRRARLLDLQLEGIREAPLGIVVACDRRANSAGVLGRASFPDTDLWSCACAIQNMWLAARAAGLGIGWVTLFQPAELADLLGLPDGVETLGWLCLGWPDERPPDPGLERFGWSQRLKLNQVVLAERWPAAGAPAAPPSHLAATTPDVAVDPGRCPTTEAGAAAAATDPGKHQTSKPGDVAAATDPGKHQTPDAASVTGPSRHEIVHARDTGERLLTAPGSLGVLDAAVNRLIAVGHRDTTTGTLVLVAARHPVTRHQISAYSDSITDDVFAATASGASLGAAAARSAGLAVTAHWARARQPQGDLVDQDALTDADVRALIEQGQALGHGAAAAGLVCLGEVGVGNTTVAAALAGALLSVPGAELVGLGAGSDTSMLRRKRAVVSAAQQRAAKVYGTGLSAPQTALAALGGPEFAVLAGVVLGAVQAGSAVVLDGLATGVAALAAVRMQPAAQGYLIAGQRSRELAHQRVLTELGLEPVLELRLRAGEGVGACLAAQLLLTGLTIRRTAGRVDH